MAAGAHLTVNVKVRIKWVHQCPPRGSGVMPCCGRTPFEVPTWNRMTLDSLLVTCPGPEGMKR